MLKERRYNNAEVRMHYNNYCSGATGYAAVFNQLSNDLGGFKEVIKPGAFAKSIQTSDIRALINHDSNLVLGRNKSGTLRLEEDNIGLRFEVSLPDTSYANDLKESLKRGDISNCSFGFTVLEDQYRDDKTGIIRELVVVDLFDISIVTYPAYQGTKVGLK